MRKRIIHHLHNNATEWGLILLLIGLSIALAFSLIDTPSATLFRQ